MPEPPQINDFDDASIAEIARVVHRLRQQVWNLQAAAERASRGASLGAGWIQAGYTTTNAEHDTYPDCGCTFVVRKETWQHDETPGGTCGREDSGAHDESQDVVAQTVGGHYLPENTRVLLVPLPSITRGLQWWILTGPVFEALDVVSSVYDTAAALMQHVELIHVPVLAPCDVDSSNEQIAQYVECDSGSAP